MNNILTSASKIVFIMLACTMCIAFLFLIMVGRITLDAKDFVMLVSMAFTFYFANKGDSSAPFAGK